MSDLLTHWAALDDCSRLARHDDRIAPAFREVLGDELSFARLGTISFGGNSWMRPVLEAVRASGGPGASERNRRNLSFVLGGLVHQAVDRVMKPVLSEAAGMDWNDAHYRMQGKPGYGPISEAEIRKVQEVSGYFDAEVFREVYLGGEADPVSAFFMGRTTGRGAAFEDVIFGMFQRALLACHTLKPDGDNIEAWLDELARKVQPFYLRVPEWVAAFQTRDPARLADYGIETRFYRRDVPTILAARTLLAGGVLPDDLHERAIRRGETTSTYGEVLQKGLAYLRNGSAFWAGTTDVLDTSNYG